MEQPSISNLYALAPSASPDCSSPPNPFAPTSKDISEATMVTDAFIGTQSDETSHPIRLFKQVGGKILELVELLPNSITVFSLNDQGFEVEEYSQEGNEFKSRIFKVDTDNGELALLSRFATGMWALDNAIEGVSLGNIGKALDETTREFDGVVDVSVWQNPSFVELFSERIGLSLEDAPEVIKTLLRNLDERSKTLEILYTRRAEVIMEEGRAALSLLNGDAEADASGSLRPEEVHGLIARIWYSIQNGDLLLVEHLLSYAQNTT